MVCLKESGIDETVCMVGFMLERECVRRLCAYEEVGVCRC